MIMFKILYALFCIFICLPVVLKYLSELVCDAGELGWRQGLAEKDEPPGKKVGP